MRAAPVSEFSQGQLRVTDNVTLTDMSESCSRVSRTRTLTEAYVNLDLNTNGVIPQLVDRPSASLKSKLSTLGKGKEHVRLLKNPCVGLKISGSM
ncbi:hypothetical protein Baya_7091 [Bagarius yarrelli]|uniref:Uncharacterized protein n=1 Tax=Bagarius yarrelli TaxID=175774 RepID=A0A556TZ80_BAGYA|nr:hypothetical protein Baya_7091 [Bagarius yarrelli]